MSLLGMNIVDSIDHIPTIGHPLHAAYRAGEVLSLDVNSTLTSLTVDIDISLWCHYSDQLGPGLKHQKTWLDIIG